MLIQIFWNNSFCFLFLLLLCGFFKEIILIDLLEKLQGTVLEVPFIKKNGDKRVMLCTLMEDLLPETNGGGRELPENLITVFDLEAQGWRTINLATITWDDIREMN